MRSPSGPSRSSWRRSGLGEASIVERAPTGRIAPPRRMATSRRRARADVRRAPCTLRPSGTRCAAVRAARPAGAVERAGPATMARAVGRPSSQRAHGLFSARGRACAGQGSGMVLRPMAAPAGLSRAAHRLALRRFWTPRLPGDLAGLARRAVSRSADAGSRGRERRRATCHGPGGRAVRSADHGPPHTERGTPERHL